MTQFAQTGLLLKQNLKRDRLKIISWLIILAGIFIAVAAKFENIYGTTKEIEVISQTLRTKGMVSIMGTIPSGQLNTAIVFSREMAIFWALFLIIFNSMIAVGSSRRQEESGLTEMILGGHSVGRAAPLTAAALEIFIVNLVFSLLTALGLMAANMPGSENSGNWLFAFTLGGIGFVFGLLALLFSQLSADSHTVSIYAYAFLAISYLARMITDVLNTNYTWFSPLGWIEKVGFYTKNRFLPLWLMAILSGITLLLTFSLSSKRDLGAGLFQLGQGKSRSRLLKGPISLLLWQERNTSLIWIIGMALLGGSYGSIFNNFGKIADQTPVVQKVLGQGAVHQMEKQQLLGFVGVLGIVFGLLSTVAGTLIVNRIYKEEHSSRLHNVLAKAISRTHLLAAYTVYAFIFSSLLLFIALMTTMAIGNSTLDTALDIDYFLRVFYAVVPISWLFLSLMVFLIGTFTRLKSIVWFYLIFSFMISYLGPLANLPKWAMKLSPFYWIKGVPLHTIDFTPLTVLFVLSFVLLLIGFIGYNKRDIA